MKLGFTAYGQQVETLAKTIRVRHPLPAENVRLVEGLGFSIIIDPTAPSCEQINPDRLAYMDRVCPACRELDERTLRHSSNV